MNSLCMIHWPIVDIHESFFICREYLQTEAVSADGTAMDDEKENDMENFINNAPFALVLVFLVIGFVLLIKGADFFVEGSSSVAKKTGMCRPLLSDLTIVAMGTSLPETAVSVTASLADNNDTCQSVM